MQFHKSMESIVYSNIKKEKPTNKKCCTLGKATNTNARARVHPHWRIRSGTPKISHILIKVTPHITLRYKPMYSVVDKYALQHQNLYSRLLFESEDHAVWIGGMASLCKLRVAKIPDSICFAPRMNF